MIELQAQTPMMFPPPAFFKNLLSSSIFPTTHFPPRSDCHVTRPARASVRQKA